MDRIMDLGEIYGNNIVEVGDGTELHVHFANNAGRGRDNVTITRVPLDTARRMYVRMYPPHVVLARTRTSGWAGKVNFSRAVRARLSVAQRPYAGSSKATF